MRWLSSLRVIALKTFYCKVSLRCSQPCVINNRKKIPEINELPSVQPREFISSASSARSDEVMAPNLHFISGSKSAESIFEPKEEMLLRATDDREVPQQPTAIKRRQTTSG